MQHFSCGPHRAALFQFQKTVERFRWPTSTGSLQSPTILNYLMSMCMTPIDMDAALSLPAVHQWNDSVIPEDSFLNHHYFDWAIGSKKISCQQRLSLFGLMLALLTSSRSSFWKRWWQMLTVCLSCQRYQSNLIQPHPFLNFKDELHTLNIICTVHIQ